MLPQIRKLLLNWKDPATHINYFVALLEKDPEGYTFYYNQSILKEAIKKGFDPFVGFSEENKIYKSNKLFPIFERRIPDKNRNFFIKLLNEYTDINSSNDPSWDYLSISKGKLATDSLSFEQPIVFLLEKRGAYLTCEVAGWTYTAEKNRVLNKDDELFPVLDESNVYDPHAVEIRDPLNNNEKVGYIPKPYNSFFYSLLKEGLLFEIVVVRLASISFRPKILIHIQNIEESDRVVKEFYMQSIFQLTN
jgi:hypothetical protein